MKGVTAEAKMILVMLWMNWDWAWLLLVLGENTEDGMLSGMRCLMGKTR